MIEDDPHLRPVRAMLRFLDADSREAVARALHQQVHAPDSAAARRVAELGALAQLLDEIPQPPEYLPYVERKTYDERRAIGLVGPTSEWLTNRYGSSWKRACWAAWTLREDGRKTLGGTPYPRHHGGRRPPPYTADECIASIRACATAIGRPPSSSEYHRWSIEIQRRAREAGRNIRVARMSVVLAVLAPDAPPRKRWSLARACALDV